MKIINENHTISPIETALNSIQLDLTDLAQHYIIASSACAFGY